ncbi:MAG: PEGA domain-containing protein [Bacteroidota bacterium]
MKNSLLAIQLCSSAFFVLVALNISAQEFDIRSFSVVPNDLSARKEVRRTVNDEPCSLIKVVTNIKGMQFQSNIGIVDVSRQADGYWVYVAPRERRIKLLAEGYLSRDVSMPEPAEELAVYELVVSTAGTQARGSKSDLVSVTFRLNEDEVFIRSGNNAPIESNGKSAVFNLPKGTRSFSFYKDGFEEQIRELDIEETTVLDIEMLPGTETSAISVSGFIVITSEPAGAEVFLNDQKVGTTPYQAQHVTGSYELALRSYLYYDYVENFELKDRSTYELPQIELKPQFGYITIYTEPTDAEVFINDKSIGQSPIYKRQLGSGYHSVRVRKSKHYESSESFTLEDSEEKNITLDLKPAFGRLEITSEPSKAAVFIDEVKVGRTPYINETKSSGTYNVRVEKDLFAPTRSVVTIKDEESVEEFYALTANFGTLIVESEGSEIYLDGKLAGANRVEQQLKAGQYLVEARKPKHTNHTQAVFVMVGSTKEVELSPVGKYGALSILTTPFEAAGAEIWVDGRKTEYKTPSVFELLEGKYEIRLIKPPFNEEYFSIIIEENIEIKKEISMTDKSSFPSGTVHCKNGGTEVVEVTNPTTGRTWMDRNLGALRVANDIQDKMAMGDLYQWGRFSDGHQCRSSKNTSALSSTAVPNHGYFILAPDYRGMDIPDFDWLIGEHDNLWNGTHGLNNPCPSNFRIPTNTEWEEEIDTWKSKDINGGFESTLKIVFTGTRHITKGYLYNDHVFGMYWGIHSSNNESMRFTITSYSAEVNEESGSASGYGIRCIKD